MGKRLSVTDDLVRELHGAGKLRVWSIIVTLFGDAIVPRGGVISLSSIQNALNTIAIEPNAVRTALSRLAKDGWIMRRKTGRQSFYFLTPDGLELFETATARIYAGGSPKWDGCFHLVICKDIDQKSRNATLRIMRQNGYGSPSPDLYVRPVNKGEELDGSPENALAVMRADHLHSDYLHAFVSETWQTPALNLKYKKFLEKYAAVADAIKSSGVPSQAESLALRLMLIHDWRRLILQDVDLPIELKSEEWLGEKARKLTASLYQQLLESSECFLDDCDASVDQKLPRADALLHERFNRQYVTKIR